MGCVPSAAVTVSVGGGVCLGGVSAQRARKTPSGGGVCLGGVHLPPVDRQTPVKTLPSQTSFADGNKFTGYKWYSLKPNFFNIDVNHKCSFLREKIARYSWVFVVT